MKANCISCFNTEQIEALQHELASRFCKQNMMVFDLASYTVVRLTIAVFISKPIPMQAFSYCMIVLLIEAVHLIVMQPFGIGRKVYLLSHPVYMYMCDCYQILLG